MSDHRRVGLNRRPNHMLTKKMLKKREVNAYVWKRVNECYILMLKPNSGLPFHIRLGSGETRDWGCGGAVPFHTDMWRMLLDRPLYLLLKFKWDILHWQLDFKSWLAVCIFFFFFFFLILNEFQCAFRLTPGAMYEYYFCLRGCCCCCSCCCCCLLRSF